MRLPKWPFWVWPLGAIVVILGLNTAAWLPRLTNTVPDFCLSCHAQGDTPNIGVSSKIHPSYDEVKCIDCHGKPGHFFIPDIYQEGVEATVERVSANCWRCHEDVLTRDPSDFKFNVMGIRIPHRFHMEIVGAECAYCHSNIAHDWHDSPTNRPRMEYCYECHSRSDPCSKCHAQGVPVAGGPALAAMTPVGQGAIVDFHRSPIR